MTQLSFFLKQAEDCFLRNIFLGQVTVQASALAKLLSPKAKQNKIKQNKTTS